MSDTSPDTVSVSTQPETTMTPAEHLASVIALTERVVELSRHPAAQLERDRGPDYDEAAAMAYGSAVVDEADRLIAMFAQYYPQSGDWGAARHAKANALALDDDRLCGWASLEQRAGLRLQADWWRAVYREINDRESPPSDNANGERDE